MKLNLGSGRFKKKGFVNVDSAKETKPDVFHDLDNFPYPFYDDSITLIEADHLLEHLKDPFEVMKELHRILKPKGELTIKVPHVSRGFSHPDHKRGFDVSFPLYFQKDFKGGYCGVSFALESIELTWFAQPYLKKVTLSRFQYVIGNILNAIINPAANFSPYLCSRIWCYWVGGFEEVKYVFRKI